MLYSDGIHLISSESFSELQTFCDSIGIKRHWFHKNSKFEHYDIPKKLRSNFFILYPQVIQVSSKEIVSILKKRAK